MTTDSGDETRRPVTPDLQPLQPYSRHPDVHGDLRRDYARVCAERDASRVENTWLRAALLPLAACDVAADRADDGVYYRTLTVGDVRRARTLLQSPAISSMMISEP